MLVVDDSLSIQQTVHQAFAGTPHVEVSACGDVPAAETLLAQRRHDLVLCDVVLPGRPGYELCEQITRGTLPDRPLVYLLTGNFEPFDPERARQVGADDVISKPFSPEDLRLRLLNVLAP
ncbi:MAG: response regulator, partial [Xanthomonadales bacterium]|nr:response regulator [Xanthomonadales bacterium]NIX12234.1 response regulator [Xanthomonadales bacterium]